MLDIEFENRPIYCSRCFETIRRLSIEAASANGIGQIVDGKCTKCETDEASANGPVKPVSAADPSLKTVRKRPDFSRMR